MKGVCGKMAVQKCGRFLSLYCEQRWKDMPGNEARWKTCLGYWVWSYM